MAALPRIDRRCRDPAGTPAPARSDHPGERGVTKFCTLTERIRWVLGVEFKTFVNAFVRLPCQVVRTGRKLVYRLLGWNRYQPIFFRLLDVLRC